jgi:hypothetical protein
MIAQECADRPDDGYCETERHGAAYALALLQSVPEVDVFHSREEIEVECRGDDDQD